MQTYTRGRRSRGGGWGAGGGECSDSTDRGRDCSRSAVICKFTLRHFPHFRRVSHTPTRSLPPIILVMLVELNRPLFLARTKRIYDGWLVRISPPRHSSTLTTVTRWFVRLECQQERRLRFNSRRGRSNRTCWRPCSRRRAHAQGYMSPGEPGRKASVLH
jgi:hypothetical protein